MEIWQKMKLYVGHLAGVEPAALETSSIQNPSTISSRKSSEMPKIPKS
jgi:hypothetical protein